MILYVHTVRNYIENESILPVWWKSFSPSSSFFLSNRLYCYHWANCRIRKKLEIFFLPKCICCTSLLFYTWCNFCCFVYCVNVSLFLCMSLLTASILSLSQRLSSLNKWGVSGMYFFVSSIKIRHQCPETDKLSTLILPATTYVEIFDTPLSDDQGPLFLASLF